MIEKPIIFGTYTLNNQAVRKAQLTIAPYYDWWVQTAQWVVDVKSDPQPRPRSDGEYPGLQFKGSVRLNLGGVLLARDITALRLAEQEFLTECWDLTFRNLHYTNWGQGTKILSMRCSQLPLLIDTIEGPNGWKRSFTVQFYAFTVPALPL